MAAPVLPLAPIKLAAGPSPITPDQAYWATFKSHQLLPTPSSNPVTSITSPVPSLLSTSSSSSNVPANPARDAFAVTSGSRVQIYDTKSLKILKTISRFGVDDVAHSGAIRRDGRILLAGGNSGAIQAFDINSRAVLKTWREHKLPVWHTSWHPEELTSCVSCSDDRTVRLWDLPSEASVRTFAGHRDYVRCGAWMEGQARGLFVSGSYDQCVRVWDSRSQERGGCVMTFQHRAAVEAVLPLGGGTQLVTAADNAISVLDLVGARPLNVLRNHQKTVTALSLAQGGKRVVSGGLDGLVKVFETENWEVVAGFKYQSPVLALDVVGVQRGEEVEDRHLVVGMQSGLISIRTRLSGQQKAIAKEKQKEMQALIEGRIEEYDRKTKGKQRGRGWEKRLRGRDFRGEGADIVINGNERDKPRKQGPWGDALRKGKYEKALDYVLESNKASKIDVLTLLTALRHRSALRTALKGRDEVTLQPILKWLNKNLGDPRHVKLTTDVSLLILDLYAGQMGQSHEIDALVERLHDRVRLNAELSQQAWSTMGMIEMLTNGQA